MYRSGKDPALEHPVRATLRERLAEVDGPIPLADLAKAAEVGISQARYHVRVLASRGLAAVDADDGVTLA